MKRAQLDQMTQKHYDILIIGGGITGAATARDAALRGLSVALLEKNDFASGTSSRSTKLLHGGIRYLEQFEFKLVREACHERELMLKIAAHLAHPVPFIYLLYKGERIMNGLLPLNRLTLKIGMTLYDILSGNPKERHHRIVNRDQLLQLEPALRSEGLIGGGYYYDFLTDDARMTIETLKGAEEAGADLVNYAEVVQFHYEANQVAGVVVQEKRVNHSSASDHRYLIQAKQVINCSGPWTDQVIALEDQKTVPMLKPTKGVHIVLRKQDFPLNHAVFLNSPRDGRVVWPIPALDQEFVYIGTTDTYYDQSLDQVTATEDDIHYLLEVANHTFPERRLTVKDVVGSWAGLRPLIAPQKSANGKESTISREHEIVMSDDGLLTITGGKLTTARVMGKEVIDYAMKRSNKSFSIERPVSSTTEYVPVSGGDPQLIADAKVKLAQFVTPLVNGTLSESIQERLLNRYGSNVEAIIQRIVDDPKLIAPIGERLIKAEVHYVVEEEMALTLTDFFCRRVSLFYWDETAGLDVIDSVAQIMGSLLNWSEAQENFEKEQYQEWVKLNRHAFSGF